MNRKIILSADSTCDIGAELEKRFDVQMFHYHIQVGEKSYIDKIEIQPEDLYRAWREDGILPKTAAITPADYRDYFEKWVKDGYEIVHVNLGSSLSSAYQNCCLVAEELGGIYPVDSCTLSNGSGLLVVKAGEMIQKGMSAAEIQKELVRLRDKTHAGFVLDTLEFMVAGGRCSAVAAFGANMLKLKPSIKVDTSENGAMSVSKKYRGSMEKVVAEYIRDQLAGRDDLDLDHIFIPNSGAPQSDVELMRAEVKKYGNFKEIHETRASGTISSHCGPRTLGMFFMTK